MLKSIEHLLLTTVKLNAGSQFKLPGVNSLILMDATTIQLCLDVFPWATYTQTKGAIKLHFGLNDNGYLRYICKCGYDSGVDRALFIFDSRLHSIHIQNSSFNA